MITTTWKSLKEVLADYSPSEEYIRKANRKLSAAAARLKHPFMNMLCLVCQAELVRIGFGADIRVYATFPDGKEKKMRIVNTDSDELFHDPDVDNPFTDQSEVEVNA